MYLKLIYKNIFRHKLRSLLTIAGLVVAILSFGLLQTVVHAWYAGADMASANRLITRNATSLVFSLPAYYRERIRALDGVNAVAISNWFGGIYKDQSFKNFFASFGVDHDIFFDLYPEFKVNPDELLAFKKDRRGAMVGRLIADQHGFKVGDVIPMTSPIYGGGTWEFNVRGIYEPKDETTVTRQLYFHWDYINEQMKKRFPRRAEFAGVFVVQIADGARAAEISQAIDKEFRNSLAETLTETEKAFSLGFVAQTEAIVTAVRNGDDRARAACRERHLEGAGLRPRLRRGTHHRRVDHDRRHRRSARHPAHLPRRGGVQVRDGIDVSRVLRDAADRDDAGRVRRRSRIARGAAAVGARGAGEDRGWVEVRRVAA